MANKPVTFYKLNLVLGIVSFLVTISFRNEVIYGVFDDIHLARTVLMVWNWGMLISLAIGVMQTLNFTFRDGGYIYCSLSILVIVLFIYTTIGMFIVPAGTILS